MQMRKILLAAGFLALSTAVCAQNKEMKPVAVGKPAPDFTATGIDGKPFKLSEVTASGKNVALMFSRAHW